MLSGELLSDILEGKHYSDRPMIEWVLIKGIIAHLKSAYALQVGSNEVEKITFWYQRGDVVCGIPLSQGIVLDDNLNGHVGEGRR